METYCYTLPAYWASYLINNDVSSFSSIDQYHADEFLAKHNLPAPFDCSDDAWFARSNDATNIGGYVLEYSFLL